ncbi:hypothetical protein AVEN_8966-1 [Araneus ventricosus]|uniref:Uncharacterized protein n=1 Tax=Araneus ventricosus TaxID=182803 RepID=A0A4Y2JTG0_ARAVE|nr:hypothetical protein AVEN_8966-1 [Araneus ventricosus]
MVCIKPLTVKTANTARHANCQTTAQLPKCGRVGAGSRRRAAMPQLQRQVLRIQSSYVEKAKGAPSSKYLQSQIQAGTRGFLSTNAVNISKEGTGSEEADTVMALEVAGTGSGAVMFEEEVAVFPEEISEAIAAAAPSEVVTGGGVYYIVKLTAHKI